MYSGNSYVKTFAADVIVLVERKPTWINKALSRLSARNDALSADNNECGRKINPVDEKFGFWGSRTCAYRVAFAIVTTHASRIPM